MKVHSNLRAKVILRVSSKGYPVVFSRFISFLVLLSPFLSKMSKEKKREDMKSFYMKGPFSTLCPKVEGHSNMDNILSHLASKQRSKRISKPSRFALSGVFHLLTFALIAIYMPYLCRAAGGGAK